MLAVTEAGLYCARGDFHIDPWRPVDRALITHAHSDHARPGSRAYLCSEVGAGVLQLRLGASASIRGIPYGVTLDFDGVCVSFHPAGHVLGSAQIRVEYRGEVWVVSGDYKLQPDPTCRPFEPVRCHTFITESTFGLPIYRWPQPSAVFAEMAEWWQANQAAGRTSVLFGYSLGKAQRLLRGAPANQGPILVHPAVAQFLPAFCTAGVTLPEAPVATVERVRSAEGKALVIAPPMTADSTWMDALGDVATAFASGWMMVRGFRRRRGGERGFVLSDHADWPGLLEAIRSTGASRILVTHGATNPLVRWLRQQGWEADSLVEEHRPPSTPSGDHE
ncbi:MAG: ligase-associated DNA damage response exonuclease [Verrucomicrobiales bacterium]|nr:ligase-associated DNA damage response exonuclease [Verrucomicrobiales bacterium]